MVVFVILMVGVVVVVAERSDEQQNDNCFFNVVVFEFVFGDDSSGESSKLGNAFGFSFVCHSLPSEGKTGDNLPFLFYTTYDYIILGDFDKIEPHAKEGY